MSVRCVCSFRACCRNMLLPASREQKRFTFNKQSFVSSLFISHLHLGESYKNAWLHISIAILTVAFMCLYTIYVPFLTTQGMEINSSSAWKISSIVTANANKMKPVSWKPLRVLFKPVYFNWFRILMWITTPLSFSKLWKAGIFIMWHECENHL